MMHIFKSYLLVICLKHFNKLSETGKGCPLVLQPALNLLVEF